MFSYEEVRRGSGRQSSGVLDLVEADSFACEGRRQQMGAEREARSKTNAREVTASPGQWGNGPGMGITL